MSALASRALTALSVLLLLAAAAAGALGGVRLGEAASKPDVRRVEVTHPEAPRSVEATAASGFSGFGGAPALRGDVLRTGTVQSVTATEVVVASDGSNVTLRYSTAERFFRIAPVIGAASNASLRPGDVVQLRVADGRVTAVLRLPAGLEQGSNR